MTLIQWSPNFLTQEQLDSIHTAAVELAETVGVLVDHSGLLERLAGLGGVRIAHNRVHFRSDRIEAALGVMRFPPTPPGEFAIISGAYLISVQDINTGQIRPTTQVDLVSLVKLISDAC